MTKTLAVVASLIALGAAMPLAAQEDRACLDEACTLRSIVPQGAADGDAATPTHYGRWGFDLAGMDRSVKPGDDWFDYVNGTWAKKTTIPPTAPPTAHSQCFVICPKRGCAR